jgi:hypothetical protein
VKRPVNRRLTPPYLRGANRLLIHLRFLRYVLTEFRGPIGVVLAVVLGGGTVLNRFYHHQPVGLGKACYSVFLMIFFG